MQDHRSLVVTYIPASLFAAIIGLLSHGCATSYRFYSTPPGASVYYRSPTQKVLIGETPIEYSKAAFPTDAPFLISVEKPGYESKEVAVTPTDNSLTTLTVQLKAKEAEPEEAGLKKVREILKQVFVIQENIAQKHYVEALAGLKTLESASPHLVEVFVLRGSVYILLDDKVRAQREWEKALQMDPSLDDLKVHLSKLKKGVNVTP